jgi:very-short-patch-repair endonuclease
MPKRIDNARLLRHRSTDAERRLWYFVRNRQLDGCRFRRQAPLGRYVADFVCVERRLVVELDGSQHADEAERDAARTRSLEDAGFVVLRFWNNDVFGNVEGVLEVIIRHLVARATPSPPNPPLEGEG